MRIFLIITALSWSAFAVSPTITGISHDSLSHSSLRILGTSDIPLSKQYVKYSVIQGDGSPNSGSPKTEQATVTAFSQGIYGLKPGETYYFRACGIGVGANNTEGCSDEYGPITMNALPVDRYARPVEPTVPGPVEWPVTYSRVLYVDPANQCNNGTTGTEPSVVVDGVTFTNVTKCGLQACIDDAANDAGSGNIAIVGEGTHTCIARGGAFAYMMRTRSGGGTGWIDIRTRDYTAFPPGGVRNDPKYWDVSRMMKIRGDSKTIQGGAINSFNNASKYRWIGLDVTNAVRTDGYYTITNVAGGVYTLNQAPGWMTGDPVQIWQNDSDTEHNRVLNCLVAMVTTTSFSCSTSSRTDGTITNGAHVIRDNSQGFGNVINPANIASNTSGTYALNVLGTGALSGIPSAAGNAGNIYVVTDGTTASCAAGGGSFRCTMISNGTTWGTLGWVNGSIINLWQSDSNMAANWIFRCTVASLQNTSGVTFTCGTAAPGYNSNGTVTNGRALVQSLSGTHTQVEYVARVDVTDSDIVFDRNYIYGTVMPMSIKVGLKLAGTNMTVANSTVKDTIHWTGINENTLNSYTGLATEVATLEITTARNLRVENNLIDSPGITIFAQGAGGSTPSHDALFLRNTITTSDYRSLSNPNGDRFNRKLRQLLELKNGYTYRIAGNQFSKNWHNGITGSFAGTIVLTPRAADGGTSSSNNKLNDIIIEDNIFHDTPGLFTVLGNDFDALIQIEPAKRIWIVNNLAYNVNGYLNKWAGTEGNVSGQILYGSAIQDMLVDHNTFWDVHGTNPHLFTGSFDPVSGLKITNNIVGINTTTAWNWFQTVTGLVPAIDNTGTPYERFQKHTSYHNNSRTVDTSSALSNNLFVSGTTSDANPNYNVTGIDQTTCEGLWSGDTTNKCISGSTAAIRMDNVRLFNRNTIRANFRTRYNSPAKSGATTKITNDGLDVGADLDRLDSVAGRLPDPPTVVRLSGGDAIRYIAPTASEVCKLNPNNNIATGTWIEDTPGSRVRTTPVTFAGSSVAYFACGVQMYSCPAAGGNCTKLNEE